MKFDITIFPDDLKKAAELAGRIERSGFDGFWTAETAHDPFLPLSHAAATTERIDLGTQIAVAFARSPMVTASVAWDLQRQTGGRFILGLGTQVKAHIERRFGIKWEAPVSRMREYIESLRAIWNCWQNNEPLRYRGEHYTFTLMSPFFNPGPIDHPDIPIYIAGVNARICQLAGEHCQGLHAHAFHTPRYLAESILPHVEAGLQASGRSRSDFTLVVPIFIVTGRDADEMQRNAIKARAHIAFYASTPTYRAVMEHHGWEDIADTLSQMARRNQWDTMWQQVTNEMLHEIAIVAAPEKVTTEIQARYEGLADRICFGSDASTADGDAFLDQIAASIASLREER
jgi:probable F420-dependent oxidoreductase